MIARKLECVERIANGFDVKAKYKDKERFFVVRTTLDIDEVLSLAEKNKSFTLVVLNTKDNFELVVEKWNNLVTLKELIIIFVNPFSQLETKWVISPYTHHKICDNHSLKLGLKAMFETVDPITVEEANERVKG